jgi:hypothetical protein
MSWCNIAVGSHLKVLQRLEIVLEDAHIVGRDRTRRELES